MSDSVTPWTAALQASLSITNSQSLFKLMSIESVMPSSRLILCHPLLLLPSIFPSIRVFSNESVLCIRWPLYWSFSFSISPSSGHPGLISFRMDWLDLLVCYKVSSLLCFYPQSGTWQRQLGGFQLESKTSDSSVQFTSVIQSCPTLCDPMNCSTPGLPVHHQLPEFTQTHVQ